jgi:hypothetical protein
MIITTLQVPELKLSGSSQAIIETAFENRTGITSENTGELLSETITEIHGQVFDIKDKKWVAPESDSDWCDLNIALKANFLGCMTDTL